MWRHMYSTTINKACFWWCKRKKRLRGTHKWLVISSVRDFIFIELRYFGHTPLVWGCLFLQHQHCGIYICRTWLQFEAKFQKNKWTSHACVALWNRRNGTCISICKLHSCLLLTKGHIQSIWHTVSALLQTNRFLNCTWDVTRCTLRLWTNEKKINNFSDVARLEKKVYSWTLCLRKETTPRTSSG